MASERQTRRTPRDQSNGLARATSAALFPSRHAGHVARALAGASSSPAAMRQLPAAIGALQRTVGNRAAERLLRSGGRGPSPSVGAEGGRLDDETDAAVRRARRGGRPLDAATSELIQRAMGADFSAVRIHADGESERLNRSLNSEAFTTGTDIFIRPGSYRPTTPSGQRLLTHELAHIVQQGGASPNCVQTKLTVGPAHGPLEADAGAAL